MQVTEIFNSFDKTLHSFHKNHRETVGIHKKFSLVLWNSYLESEKAFEIYKSFPFLNRSRERLI